MLVYVRTYVYEVYVRTYVRIQPQRLIHRDSNDVRRSANIIGTSMYVVMCLSRVHTPVSSFQGAFADIILRFGISMYVVASPIILNRKYCF